MLEGRTEAVNLTGADPPIVRMLIARMCIGCTVSQFLQQTVGKAGLVFPLVFFFPWAVCVHEFCVHEV